MSGDLRAAAGGGEALVLFGGDLPEAPMEWALVDIASARITARGAVGGGGPAPAAAPQRTVLVLPGAEAQVKRVEIPARTEAQARTAAAYLFEGALAAGDNVHYAIGEAQDEGGHRLVAAIDGERIADWLRNARGYGADPQHVYLDFTLWPTRPGEVDIVSTPRRVMVAGGARGGFSIEPALAPSLLARWLTRIEGKPSVMTLHGGDVGAWSAHLGGGVLQQRAAADPIAVLAAAALAAPDYAPNLCQGRFGVGQAQARSPWRVWRFAAALALLAVTLQVFSLAYAGWQDHRAAAVSLARSEQAFRATRPDVQRVVNLKAQTQALVNAMRQSTAHPVLRLSEPTIRALQTQPMVRLDGVLHEAPASAVRLRFSGYQPAQLEGVAADMRAQGLAVEVGEMSSVDGEVHAEFVVEGAP